jgi:hypothetical protein
VVVAWLGKTWRKIDLRVLGTTDDSGNSCDIKIKTSTILVQYPRVAMTHNHI